MALRDKLKHELREMVNDDIIAPVSEPTEWVSSLLLVSKPRQLRICMDPRDLNRAIKREHYQMPTIEEIATRLSGARVFTVVDAKNGFWQVELDEESSRLTTFNTPFGRYRWKRMPFWHFQRTGSLTEKGARDHRRVGWHRGNRRRFPHHRER